ncbi:hypothetical protein [Proteus mirabilis]
MNLNQIARHCHQAPVDGDGQYCLSVTTYRGTAS